MEYLDYTRLMNHRERMWRAGSNFSLNFLGGVDLPALGAAAVTAVATGAIVLAVFLLFAIPAVVPLILISAAMFVGTYLLLTSENVKATPKILLLRVFMRFWQPRSYNSGVNAGKQANSLRWQVVLWRPDWAPVRIGSPRRFVTYDPAVIGEENRKILDVTSAGELVGWTRFANLEGDETI